MSELITLIALLCSQTGSANQYHPPTIVREEAFAAQSACTKRLFKACTSKHIVTGASVPKSAECLIESL